MTNLTPYDQLTHTINNILQRYVETTPVYFDMLQLIELVKEREEKLEQDGH